MIAGKTTVYSGKNFAINPVRALELANRIGSAAATRNLKAALAATSELINFATTGESIKVVEKNRGLFLCTRKNCY